MLRSQKVTALCLVSALSAGCYLSPDSSRIEDSVSYEAGVMQPPLDAGNVTSIDASGPVDAALPVDTGPVDAGCTSNDFCAANTPLCSAGDCVSCKQHQDCSRFAATPACGPTGACVACAPDQKQLCVGANPACDPTTNKCAQCVADADCPSDQKAACQADRTCGQCTEDAECTRFGKVCDSRKGACVLCRPETEEADCRSDKACDPKLADCAGTACDPKTLSCTTKARGSVSTCQSCVSDSECAPSHGCIALFFGEGGSRKELGGYCMKVASTGCARPYGAPLTRDSLSGKAPQPYCGLSELSATCESVKALDENKTCTGADESCGVLGGRCETVNFIGNSCTYACSSALECPMEVPCGGPPEDRYCGGST